MAIKALNKKKKIEEEEITELLRSPSLTLEVVVDDEVDEDEDDEDEESDENVGVKELAAEEEESGKDGGRPVVTPSILATLIEFCRVLAPIFKVGCCCCC